MAIEKNSKKSIEKFIDDYVRYIYRPQAGVAGFYENRELLAEQVACENGAAIFNLRKWYVVYNRGISGFKDVLKVLKAEYDQKESEKYQYMAEKTEKRIKAIEAGKYDPLCTNYHRHYVLHEPVAAPVVTIVAGLKNGVAPDFDYLPDDLEELILKAALQRGEVLYQEKQAQIREDVRQMEEAENLHREYLRQINKEQAERERRRRNWWRS